MWTYSTKDSDVDIVGVTGSIPVAPTMKTITYVQHYHPVSPWGHLGDKSGSEILSV